MRRAFQTQPTIGVFGVCLLWLAPPGLAEDPVGTGFSYQGKVSAEFSGLCNCIGFKRRNE